MSRLRLAAIAAATRVSFRARAQQAVEPIAPTIDPALIAAIVDEQLARRDGVTWKDGFNVRSASGDFTLKSGRYTEHVVLGRVQTVF